MTLSKEQIADRLYALFSHRLSRMWIENPPISRFQNGEPCIESRLEVADKWRHFIEEMGGSVQDWGVALHRNQLNSGDDRGVLFHNPCERPEDIYKESPSPTYILVPMEVAMRILVLGDLP